MHNSSLLRSLVSKLWVLLKRPLYFLHNLTVILNISCAVLWTGCLVLLHKWNQCKHLSTFPHELTMKQPCQNIISPTLISTTGQRSPSSIKSRAPSDQQQTSCKKKLVIMTLSKKRPGYTGTKSDGYQLRITKGSKKGEKSAMVLSPLHQTIQTHKTEGANRNPSFPITVLLERNIFQFACQIIWGRTLVK